MVVKVSKPEINVREKISELDKPSGTAGEAMLRAETPQEQFNLISAGRRNLIINGAMQVAQRGTSATTFSYGTVDRFKPSEGSTSSLAITQTQDTNAPSGFSNSLKITVTTAETMSGSKQLAVFHAMEAQNLQQLGYGTSDAQSITVSFWVKSSVTGTYCLSLYENDDNRNIGATYTINSANTWEYKTITFPPDTVGVIDNNNGGGLETYFFLSVGPDRKSADNTSWATWSAARFGYGQVADVAGTTNATWQITGVQLELGKVATPFEHRSYGEELALCQRYYQKFDADGQDYTNIGVAIATNSAWYVPIILPGGRMRTDPSLSYSAVSDFRVTLQHSNTDAVTSMIIGYNNPLHPNLSVQAGSNSASNGARMFGYSGDPNAWLAFEAEL